MTGTPFTDNGLSEGFYTIPTFGDEFGNAIDHIGPVPPASCNNRENQDEKSEGAADCANERIPPGREGAPIHLRQLG